MAASFVSAWTEWGGTGTASTSSAKAVTTGNSVIVTLATFAGSMTVSNISGLIGGSTSVTFARAGTPVQSPGGGDWIHCFYSHNLPATGNMTITVGDGSGNNFQSVGAMEWSGLENAAPDKIVYATGSGSATTNSGTSGTLTQADNLVVGGGTLSAGVDSTWTPGATYTMRVSGGLSSVRSNSYTETKVVAATTAVSAGATWTAGASDWSCYVAVFKATVTAAVDLTIANLTIVTAAEAPSVGSVPTLTVADLTIVTAAEAATLGGIVTPLTIANLTVAVTAQAANIDTGFSYPTSISGRKILDQHGDVFLLPSFSMWTLADLSAAHITTALENLAAIGQIAPTVWAGGGYSLDSTYNPRYSTKELLAGGAGNDAWWTGTAFDSSFGAAWNHMDHIADECLRLGLPLNLSVCISFGNGAGPEISTAGNTKMQAHGAAVATRYPVADYPNIVWHIMFDAPHGTCLSQMKSYVTGIESVEGTARPVRWLEPTNEESVWTDYIASGDLPSFMNGFYDNGFGGGHLARVDWCQATYAEGAVPFGDTESMYDGSPLIDAGDYGQQYRETIAAVFVEGGMYIEQSNELVWPFGKTGWITSTESGIDYTNFHTHSHSVHYGHIVSLCREFCENATYAPTNSFVTTGRGTGDTKAAAGASTTAALAYFPNSRTIAVDTTIISGTGNVRLRWYDPTDGSYTSIATSEAQQTGRSVTHPGANSNSAGEDDWLLVVDLLPTLTIADLTIAVTAQSPTVNPTLTLTVADLTIVTAADAPTLTGVGPTVSLNVADLTIAVAADSPTVNPTLTLTVADLTVAMTIETPAVIHDTTLVPLHLTIGLAADPVTLSVDDLPADLTIANLTVAVTAEAVTLGGVTDLVIANLTVAVTASNITFGQTDTVPGTVRLLTVPPDGHYRRLPGQPRPKWLNSTPTVKDPDAVLDYPIDWGVWLEAGDELDTLAATVTIHGTTPTSGTALAFVDEPVISTGGGPIARYVLFSLTGGVPGRWYAVRLHIETAQDDTDDRTRWVRVRNR